MSVYDNDGVSQQNLESNYAKENQDLRIQLA